MWMGLIHVISANLVMWIGAVVIEAYHGFSHDSDHSSEDHTTENTTTSGHIIHKRASGIITCTTFTRHYVNFVFLKNPLPGPLARSVILRLDTSVCNYSPIRYLGTQSFWATIIKFSKYFNLAPQSIHGSDSQNFTVTIGGSREAGLHFPIDGKILS